MREIFRKFAHAASLAAGSAWAFVAALFVILVWLFLGPACGFSDTWQLAVNTGTTIVTFLIVFLIQNTQNRENQALQLKLDELLRAIKEARTGLVDLEEWTEEDLQRLQKQFQSLREKPAKKAVTSGKTLSAGEKPR